SAIFSAEACRMVEQPAIPSQVLIYGRVKEFSRSRLLDGGESNDPTRIFQPSRWRGSPLVTARVCATASRALESDSARVARPAQGADSRTGTADHRSAPSYVAAPWMAVFAG